MSTLIAETGIPHWLQPPKKDRGDYYPEWVWEHILSRLMAGETLRSICSDETMPDEGRLRRWIFEDEARKTRYYDARAIGADNIEDDILEIADGLNTPGGLEEDIHRSQLRISARFKLLGIWNRKRYGEQKHVEHTHKLDLTEAIAQADARIEQKQEGRLIEGEVVSE